MTLAIAKKNCFPDGGDTNTRNLAFLPIKAYLKKTVVLVEGNSVVSLKTCTGFSKRNSVLKHIETFSVEKNSSDLYGVRGLSYPWFFSQDGELIIRLQARSQILSVMF